jgi:hypothetical protein
VQGKSIVTDRSVMNKVSGTSMAGILGVSPWASPFQVACNLLGLASEDIGGKPSVRVGRILEAPIVRYADRAYKEFGSFFLAEEVFQKREGDHDSWVSDFESDTFAGHVDGIVFNEAGEDYILEIKTSSNLDAWMEGVPKYYYWQIALYNHFICKKDHAYVVLGMVNENTYRDPMSWLPHEGTVGMYKVDFDHEEIEQGLAAVQEWYDKYIRQGITPEYDPSNPGDVAMYEHLVNLTQDVEEVSQLIEKYGEIDEEIAIAEAKNVDLYAIRDELKARIKDYLTAHNLNSLSSTSEGFVGKVGTQTRSSFDEDQMMLDGIDVEKYKVKKTVKTFSIKKNLKK